MFWEITVLCEVNHYSKTGMKPCQECVTGSEQPARGSSMCRECQGNSTSNLCKSGKNEFTIIGIIIIQFMYIYRTNICKGFATCLRF